jgi:hypothetical protein
MAQLAAHKGRPGTLVLIHTKIDLMRTCALCQQPIRAGKLAYIVGFGTPAVGTTTNQRNFVSVHRRCEKLMRLALKQYDSSNDSTVAKR